MVTFAVIIVVFCAGFAAGDLYEKSHSSQSLDVRVDNH